MKKFILFAALALTLTAPAYAQDAAPAANTPATPETSGDFSAHKQKLLQNISEHIAKMQKKQSCITAAMDEKALNACFEDGHTATR